MCKICIKRIVGAWSLIRKLLNIFNLLLIAFTILITSHSFNLLFLLFSFFMHRAHRSILKSQPRVLRIIEPFLPIFVIWICWSLSFFKYLRCWPYAAKACRDIPSCLSFFAHTLQNTCNSLYKIIFNYESIVLLYLFSLLKKIIWK